MELVVLWSKLWKEYNQQQTESPPRALVPAPPALLAALRCLVDRGSRTRLALSVLRGLHRTPCPPLVGRRDGLPAVRFAAGSVIRRGQGGAKRHLSRERRSRERRAGSGEGGGIKRERVSSREPRGPWRNERARAGGAFCAAPIRATKERGYAAQNARADRGLSRCLISYSLLQHRHRLIVHSLTCIDHGGSEPITCRGLQQGEAERAIHERSLTHVGEASTR